MTIRSTALALGASALLFALAGNAAAQFDLIAYESFDYPAGTGLGDQAGGTGWANVWWAGSAKTDVLATAPGFDAVGNKATTQVENSGAYRKPDPAAWPTITSNGYFGADGAVIWISWTQQRMPGGDDGYGGLSLFEQFANPGEKIFIGSPSGTDQLGVHDDTWGPNPTLTMIPGTDTNLVNRIVVRLDFQSGPERLRLWTNEPSAHPVTPPLLDIAVHDFVFNEVRIQSGDIALGPTGYDFDEIVIECGNCSTASLVGTPDQLSIATGGVQTLDLDVGPSNAGFVYLIMGSLGGTTGGVTLDGLYLPLAVDSYWIFTLGTPNTPPLAGSFGLLDGQGKTSATFTLPAGANPLLSGLTANHAALIVNTTGPGFFVGEITNAAPLALLP